MSAFMVTKRHIDAIMTFCVEHRVYTDATHIDASGADALGQKLWLENYRSICARYPEDDHGPEPAYTFHRLCNGPTLVEAIKLVHCLEYQSCEHDGFDEGLYHRLNKALCRTLVGYDDAAWARGHE